MMGERSCSGAVGKGGRGVRRVEICGLGCVGAPEGGARPLADTFFTFQVNKLAKDRHSKGT